MKFTLRLIGLLGTVLFSVFLSLTYHIPGYVEALGKNFIREQIREKTDQKIDSLKLGKPDSLLGKVAGKIYEQNRKKIDSLKQKLKSQAHESLANVIAQMRDLDCECRDKWAAYIKRDYEIQLLNLEAMNEKLKDFMKIKYMEVSTELKRDVRIFTGSNLLIFSLIFLISFLKPRAVTHLFLPGILLVISTGICSYFYVFEQNWLLTIIYNDYIGMGYLVYLGILFLFLSDIVFNRGRVTTKILNGILEAIGQVGTVLPC